MRSRVARLEERLDALDRLTVLRSADHDKAVDKAMAATDKRFDSVNEFRAQLSDQAARFITRDIFYARVESLEESKGSAHAALAARIDLLEKEADRRTGKGAGLAAGWGYIVTGVGLALTIATLIVIFTRRG